MFLIRQVRSKWHTRCQDSPTELVTDSASSLCLKAPRAVGLITSQPQVGRFIRQWTVETLNRNVLYPPLFSPVPPAVTEVLVTERTPTSVTLKQNVDVQKNWTYILYFQEKNMTFQAKDFLSHTLSNLQPGTEYNFSVVTNFFELNSKVYKGFLVTSKNILITAL